MGTTSGLFYKAMLRCTSLQMSDPENRLQSGLTALGLDRVVAGVRSLYTGRGSWDDCFLAMAYGKPGELDHIAEDLEAGLPSSTWLGNPPPIYDRVSHVLGVDVEHVRRIVRHFDADPEGFKAALIRWLQGRNVNVATVMSETRREVRTDASGETTRSRPLRPGKRD